MLKVFKLLNQNNKFLGSFSKKDDAIKTAKFLSTENQKIYLETWGYSKNFLGRYFISRTEILGD